MASLRATSSCGMNELHDLSSPTSVLLQKALQGPAVIVFSDAVHRGNARRLYDEIDRYGLGPVVAGEPINNPNTGNNIQAYVWNPNRAAIRARLAPKPKPRVAGKTPRRRPAR